MFHDHYTLLLLFDISMFCLLSRRFRYLACIVKAITLRFGYLAILSPVQTLYSTVLFSAFQGC